MSNFEQTIDQIKVQFVKGVGEKRAEQLKTAGIYTVADLLNFTPRKYLDRSNITPISQLEKDSIATVVGKVISKEMIRYGKKRLVIKIYDRSGIMDAVWFNQADFFARLFEAGQEIALNGRVGYYRGWQMMHPDYDILKDSEDNINTGQIIPVYSGNQYFREKKITSRAIRRLVFNALEKYESAIDENLPAELIRSFKLPARSSAYRRIHFPVNFEDLELSQKRFKFEEMFFFQILMGLRHYNLRTPQNSLKFILENKYAKKLLTKLSFELTSAQKKVVSEIETDLTSGQPMSRLVQGDVGSGKTIVALIALLHAIEAGQQAAFMAPTEILAEQHFHNIQNLLAGFDINIKLLIGSLTNSQKNEIHEQLKNGQIQLVIGTHTLVQSKVEFSRLGLIVIDEQHRFGVLQRNALIEKGLHPHLLVMTATPIPRTLALTLYGDLDTSIIDIMPSGRKPIKTFWRTNAVEDKVYKFVKDKIQEGQQAYIIYPLVEESEKMDLKAATESFKHLQNDIFPDLRLALLHGRMKSAEKEAVMAAFKSGEINILVSTTVVEVGVDVPNASILIIEHSERFGLSQLHQLRGRVGRGKLQSYCVLFTPQDISEIAEERLRLMEQSNDGFEIAEADLKFRGAGEFLGTRQHGMPDFQYIDLVRDQKLIPVVRKKAFEILSDDPQLRKKKHTKIRDIVEHKFADKMQFLKLS